jgi:aspartate/methionine/tyrosine aminotransferase
MACEEASHSNFRPVPKTGVIFVMQEAAALGYRPGSDQWANLGQGAPETGPLAGGQARLNQLAIDPTTAEYSPVGGSKALKAAVADLYNDRYRQGMKSRYGPENVAISPGGRSALTRVAASLGTIHLGHFLPDYTAYEELLDLFRAFVPIPIALPREGGFHYSTEQIRREIVGRGLGALLFSNPCNPTGNVVYGEELAAMVELCSSMQCAMIVDEFYAHYWYGPASEANTLSAAAYIEDVERDAVVVVDGLTKNWRYPGLRLSWTLGPRAVIDRLSSAGSFLDGGAAHPIQMGAIPLLKRAWADAEAASIRQNFGRKREYMMERARAMGFLLAAQDEPLGAFYLFPKLSQLPEPLQDGMAFFRKALEVGVITVPGVFFDVNPGQRRRHIPSRLRQYLRLSFGPSLEEVSRGMERLEGLIRSFS